MMLMCIQLFCVATNSEELTISSTVISDGTGFRLPPSINGYGSLDHLAKAIQVCVCIFTTLLCL